MDRYRSPVLLATGGTSEIYKAYDPVLQRPVVLKILRQTEPQLVERMLREARAQAGVDHPGVCEVYDVGWLGERPFIAMRYVEGKELGAWAAEMGRRASLDVKVELAWKVSRAVAKAHRHGLVHRDLKPANIMVEEGADGQPRPSVVDFGLVRERRNPGLTECGQVLGTPPYLAPEQISGEAPADQRADVYGLGATFYELFTGQPPFGGNASNEFSLLRQILEDEPLRPRRLVPALPADLEAVLLKCLEKDPRRRYASAGDLAEDLRRFQDGLPVLASRSSAPRRLGRTVRRHRLRVAAMVAVAVTLAGAALLEAGRRHASRHAEWMQHHAQAARDMDAAMRAALMSPAHDLRPDKARLRRRIAELEALLTGAGDGGCRGPVEFAVGSGYLALMEEERARQHLERAWEAGFRTPEVGFALGLSLSRLYQRELEQARLEPNGERRARRILELEESLKAPTLAYLRQGRTAESIPVEYVEALLALYEHRYEEALKLTRAAIARLPWRHEARMLEAEILAQQGHGHLRGGALEGARKLLEAAETAYHAVLEVAPSDPRAYEGLCRLAELNLHLEERVEEPADLGRQLAQLEEGLAACRRGTAVDGDREELRVGEARLLHRARRQGLPVAGPLPEPVPAALPAVIAPAAEDPDLESGGRASTG